ncbi:MAG: adenosine kinase [Bacteroidota bacterium]
MKRYFLLFILLSLPQLSKCQSLAEYLQQRGNLLALDSALAFDAKTTLNAEEQLANRKFVKMQQQLIAGYKEINFFPPARNFYLSKSLIEKSELFQTIRKMPKGGILHLHTKATTSAAWIADTVVHMPNCYVYWKEDSDKYVKGQISFFKESHVPAGFEKASVLNKKVTNFQSTLTSLLTLNESTANDSVNVWREFGIRFQRVSDFVSYQPIFKAYYKQGFQELMKDNVQYVELRAGLSSGLYNLAHDKKSGYYNTDTVLVYFKEIRDELRKKDLAFNLKLIYAGQRGDSEEQVYQEFERAFQYKKKYADFIIGFDLVGGEDIGHSTLYFIKTWLKRDSLEKVYQVNMPFYFHDGESNWPSDDNLYDAMLLNSKRIGHGFNLFRFPVLQDSIRKKDICIEVCPLSNQILTYIQDIRLHPGYEYLQRGVQCTISSDDPGIFGYSGLSYDYWAASVAWQFDLKSIKKLVLNSITYSGMTESEKITAWVELNKRWHIFIQSLNSVPSPALVNQAER